MSSGLKKILFLTIIIVLILLGWNYFKNKDNNIDDSSVTPNGVVIKKQYNDKDFVYDTPYSIDNKLFPYINLDYNNINGINISIKNIYDSNINSIVNSNYKYYINENILSIILTVKLKDKTNYYTYNINMENGNEIKYNDVYFKYSNIDLTLKNKIGSYIDNSEIIKSKLDNIVLTKDYVVDVSYNNYKINSLSNNVDFYLSENRTLNVIVKVELKGVYSEYAIFQI